MADEVVTVQGPVPVTPNGVVLHMNLECIEYALKVLAVMKDVATRHGHSNGGFAILDFQVTKGVEQDAG
jgi:hypothetical protein